MWLECETWNVCQYFFLIINGVCLLICFDILMTDIAFVMCTVSKCDVSPPFTDTTSIEWCIQITPRTSIETLLIVVALSFIAQIVLSLTTVKIVIVVPTTWLTAVLKLVNFIPMRGMMSAKTCAMV